MKSRFMHMRKERHTSDQHICFRYIDSRFPLPHKLKMSNLKPFGLTTQFVSHLVGNLEDRFSRDAA